MPKPGAMRLWAIVTMTLSTPCCTDADLFVPQSSDVPVAVDRLNIKGSVCAAAADEVEAFLKVMFVVDRSNSMTVTDRNNRRVSAVSDAVKNFIDDKAALRLRPGVEFAVVSFFGSAQAHTRNSAGTPGFSNDGKAVLFAATELARTGTNTGYDKALAQAFLILDSDMARLDEQAKARSRYEVVFLSDGMPFPDNCRGEANAPSAAVAAVKRIAGLQALHRVPITFHTAFASEEAMFQPGTDVDQCEGGSDPFEAQYNASLGEETRALLQAMALAGGGTFKQFRNGDAINFLSFEFKEARRIYDMSNFVVRNRNARPNFDHSLADSDGDGLSDLREDQLGTRKTLVDSDLDGFSDALEARFRSSGLDPLDPSDATCDTLGRLDSDADGLRDCEEVFLGTSIVRFDSDLDGFSDFLEFLSNTNANSASSLQDFQSDSDGDGGSDADELRWHTDPALDDVAVRSRLAYHVRLQRQANETSKACYDFQANNITLGATLAADATEVDAGGTLRRGRNRILLHFAQTPQDDPFGAAQQSMACVEARYLADLEVRLPANGRVTLPQRRPADSFRPHGVLRAHQERCHVAVDEDCGLNALWCRFDANGGCQCVRPGDGSTVSCPACSNGQDDDGDGLSDFPHDPDCFDSMDDDEAPGTACSNGQDDDGDGRTDWPFDPGCRDGYDTSETSPAALPACSDGADNDGDSATDFPNDPGCDSAADSNESDSLINPVPACSDGIDNDGDGLIDLSDGGCFDDLDIDENGPSVCFYCQRVADRKPGQCDFEAGLCKALAGPVTPACTSQSDCRGAPCVDGICRPCLRDEDCADGGICDVRKGWCLALAQQPVPCDVDADCGGGVCETEVKTCRFDPFHACRSERDCLDGQVCSNRGYCLTKVFTTNSCDASHPCESGACDLSLGWCLPMTQEQQCLHDDFCPRGQCTAGAYCDQSTFVSPRDFDEEVDCWQAY